MHDESKLFRIRRISTKIFTWKLFFSNSVITLIWSKHLALGMGAWTWLWFCTTKSPIHFVEGFNIVSNNQCMWHYFPLLSDIHLAFCQASCVICSINTCVSYLCLQVIHPWFFWWPCPYEECKFNEEICLAVRIQCAPFGAWQMWWSTIRIEPIVFPVFNCLLVHILQWCTSNRFVKIW